MSSFDKIVGLSDTPQEPLTQEELDEARPLAPFTPLHGTTGAIIGWRETGDARGRGVYARQFIAKGSCIEVAPVITVASKDVAEDGGAPDGYLLDWDPDEEGQEHCMPLGYIMLYNHSSKPTLYLENDYEALTISSFAARDIQAGEELTWDYSCVLWFDEG